MFFATGCRQQIRRSAKPHGGSVSSGCWREIPRLLPVSGNGSTWGSNNKGKGSAIQRTESRRTAGRLPRIFTGVFTVVPRVHHRLCEIFVELVHRKHSEDPDMSAPIDNRPLFLSHRIDPLQNSAPRGLSSDLLFRPWPTPLLSTQYRIMNDNGACCALLHGIRVPKTEILCSLGRPAVSLPRSPAPAPPSSRAHGVLFGGGGRLTHEGILGLRLAGYTAGAGARVCLHQQLSRPILLL